MAGWDYLIYAVISAVISYGISALTANTQKPKGAEAGQLDIATADEGATIPVCFGENIIKQSNIVWYGDSSTVAIKVSSGGKGGK